MIKFLTEVRARQLLADGYTPQQLSGLWHVPVESVLATLEAFGIEVAR